MKSLILLALAVLVILTIIGIATLLSFIFIICGVWDINADNDNQ